jgi:HPt (histidine-containing phosphotransfer) domain-containing protein
MSGGNGMSDPVHLDLDTLNELKDVMGEEFGFLIETFKTDSAVRISAINDALASQDSDAVRRAAHSFKGSASNMGATNLAELCRRLEDIGDSGSIDGGESIAEEIVSAYRCVEQALS